jgi:hypothetical protein
MRIGFCGTVSVGKTTLVKALAQLPEFKDYQTRTERSKYLMELGIPLNTDSTLKGQSVFLAERASELMLDNIITDRTIIDVMAFSQASSSMTSDQKWGFCEFASSMLNEYDHIFYVSPEGVEIEDNSVRETDAEYRKLIDHQIKVLTKHYANSIKNIHYISGSVEKRINQVKQVVFS